MPGLRGRRPRAVHRLALSPSSWGVSENRDWGHQIDVERVLSEAAAVGEGAITAGPPGFLPDRSDHARSMLRRHRLRVVAGQVHAILHHNDIRGPELAHIDGHAHWLAAVGAAVSAAADPVELAERAAGRIQHVHLNDVDLDLARRVRERSLGYREAVSRNLYLPVGEGGADVKRAIDALRAAKYRGWYTLEQETRLPTPDDRPLGRISRSLEYVLPLLGKAIPAPVGA